MGRPRRLATFDGKEAYMQRPLTEKCSGPGGDVSDVSIEESIAPDYNAEGRLMGVVLLSVM
jgi:hypothetical protein